MQQESGKSGIDRRNVLKAAAWSAPVVAMAVAMPLAAASASEAVISATAGGSITASEDSGTANGTLNGGVIIGNVIGEWETGTLYAEYELTGPWQSGVITDGAGQPFIAGSTVAAGGAVWTVVAVETDADGTWKVQFTAPSIIVSSSTTLPVPPALFRGEFIPGTATSRNPIGGTVRVSAVNVNGGNTVSNSVGYP